MDLSRRDEFHRLYTEQSYPLLQRWHFDVVAYGPSLHDENMYYVIRRFNSLSHREQMLSTAVTTGSRVRVRRCFLLLRITAILCSSWMRSQWMGCEGFSQR